MKMNKKLIVPFLSTIIGLSVAGGLGGAFAWYQFNSRVTSAFIGTSVADSGMLQIGYDDAGATATGGIAWGRKHVIDNTNLVPVTFGALDAVTGSLRDTAYGYPEAGGQNGSDYTKGWQVITNGNGFYRYDIYLRALVADPAAPGIPAAGINPGYKLDAKKVYLSDLVMEGVDDSTGGLITDALRLHLDVKNGRKTLIAKKAVTDLNLYGELDLDGDGYPDKLDKWSWETQSTENIVYGISGEKQSAIAANSIIEKPDADTGLYPSSTSTTADANLICTTSANAAEWTKITITIWLEGWALLDNDNDSSTNPSAIWNPTINAGAERKVHVGLEFNAGRNIIG